jgi:CDP-diacylglycerol--serine O-phosphatidyltransferase
LGWICCFIFLACGALRLARFNVLSTRAEEASGDFVGLPIPMAAMVIGSFILFLEDLRVSDKSHFVMEWMRNAFADSLVVNIALVSLTLLAAGAMVSNIRYYSHKSLKFGAMKPFKLLSLLVVLVGLVAYQPEAFGMVLAVGYALSGPLDLLLGRKSTRDDDDDIFHEMTQAADSLGEDQGLEMRPKHPEQVEGVGKPTPGVVIKPSGMWQQKSPPEDKGNH